MRLALAALILASNLPVFAQSSRPNFTGTYRLDPPASQGSDARSTRVRTLKIEHNDPNLKYADQSGERTQVFVLTTDGSDQVRDEPKGESRMNARWDGTALIIKSFRKAKDGTETEVVERWSLGRDGVLTVRQQTAVKGSEAGNGTEKRESTLVFRRGDR